MKKSLRHLACLAIILASSCTQRQPEESVETPSAPSVENIKYTIGVTLPHDSNAFTEGFLFHEGKLFESTGATEGLPQTRSLFGIVDTVTGKISVKAELDRNIYFGEGISILNGKIYQLTYKNKIGFVYDLKSFKQIGQFGISSEEGWGMTTDGKNLIMSDGTNILTWLDPVTLREIKSIQVAENGYAADNLNELEFINGSIYANIWQTNTIVRIDTSVGRITGKLDLTPVVVDAKKNNPYSQELNGIAYDSKTDRIFVTGKMWSNIYELKFVH